MRSTQPNPVLVAALDWGLGHATRSVPVIRELQKQGKEVILASAGSALHFYRSYFPELKVIEKPAYGITYSRKIPASLKILIQLPALTVAVIREHRWLKSVIKKYGIEEVISDNCYGLWNRKIRSVFITHQLKVKVPPYLKLLEPVTEKIIRYFIAKYNEVLVPDFAGNNNLSGELSHVKNPPTHLKFIGTLSRFSKANRILDNEKYDVVVLLSGPEPQRTILEDLCIEQLSGKDLNCCIIRGLPGTSQLKKNGNGISWYNHLSDEELQVKLLQAKNIICRSGYSTLMDLTALGLKAILIPTPGQSEQEYLAKYNNNNFFQYYIQNGIDLKKIIHPKDKKVDYYEKFKDNGIICALPIELFRDL